MKTTKQIQNQLSNINESHADRVHAILCANGYNYFDPDFDNEKEEDVTLLPTGFLKDIKNQLVFNNMIYYVK